jgi:hypothetical protein
MCVTASTCLLHLNDKGAILYARVLLYRFVCSQLEVQSRSITMSLLTGHRMQSVILSSLLLAAEPDSAYKRVFSASLASSLAQLPHSSYHPT